MILEFKQNIIDSNLYSELDFSKYLELFSCDIPIVKSHILIPQNAKSGKKHYADLQKLFKKNQSYKELILRTSKLPNIDSLLPFLKNQNLEQYHLTLLGNFLTKNSELLKEEIHLGLKLRPSFDDSKISKILLMYMEDNYSSFKYSTKELGVKSKIDKLEAKLLKGLKCYENDILKETGLKMIYPYPKEIDRDTLKLKKSNLISISTKGTRLSLNYNLPPVIKSIINEKEKLTKELQQSLNFKIENINKKISKCFTEFTGYYTLRKKRTLHYIFLYTAIRNNLILPTITSKNICKIEKGKLFALSTQKDMSYVPLDVELKKGTSVLFGANMGGKTTVLKTLYFLLTLIRFGLPVPAKLVELSFPENIEISLPTSGKIKERLSSFGEELNFLSKNFKEGSYILMDELMSSTNPISGIELSNIFLDDLSNKNSIFFCTTQYLEVLKGKNRDIFKMKDFENISKSLKGDPLKELAKKMPYKLLSISKGELNNAFQESKKPLYIALHFPLKKSLKNRIKKSLEE